MNAENLTNKDVARIAQISESTVSRVLASKGANASAATITAICNALNVTDNSMQFEVVDRAATKDEIYLARIDDLKETIEVKDKWIKALFVLSICLTAFIVLLFAVDILNPSVGWFRR